jgi:hypothetical protein
LHCHIVVDHYCTDIDPARPAKLGGHVEIHNVAGGSF